MKSSGLLATFSVKVEATFLQTPKEHCNTQVNVILKTFSQTFYFMFGLGIKLITNWKTFHVVLCYPFQQTN